MVQIYPQLKDVEVEFAWGGTLDFAFDQMPHTGELEGIYYALGFAGHGVALGTHLGMQIANAILDGTVKETALQSIRLPNRSIGIVQW